MRYLFALSIVIAGVQAAKAADIEAGKAKAAVVCAACHGAAGVSVSDTIPNLAGQKARYIEAQLRALKAGTPKNDIMNAIASQLSADDINNLAAVAAQKAYSDCVNAKREEVQRYSLTDA